MPNKRKVKKKIIKNRLKPLKEFNIILFSYKDPLNLTLHFIGWIIMIYGAWFNNILWLLLGFIPMLVGYLWEKVNKNEK